MEGLHVCTGIFLSNVGLVPDELGYSFLYDPFYLHFNHFILANLCCLTGSFPAASMDIMISNSINYLLNSFNEQELSFNLLYKINNFL